MTCTPLPGGGFSCSRGQPPVAPCDVCKKRPHTRFCDYLLRGPKLGDTCQRKLCDSCATRIVFVVDQPLDYCPAHAKTLPKPELHNKI